MIINSRSAAAFLLACLTSFGAACHGKGGDDDGGNQDAYQSCKETAKALADVNKVSALLGISAADLLDEVGNGFTTAARYADDTTILTQSPLGGETNLTVTISYDGGEIREIESVPVDGDDEFAGECLNRLEVDVAVAVSTEDGAFAENWRAVLAQTVSSEQEGFDDPILAAEFDPAGIEGSFKIVSIAGVTPDSVTGALNTTAVDPFQGSIDILVEQTSGEGQDGTVSQARHVALAWGDAR